MADTALADVEFFWDPMCPWAWITSRWVAEVARQSSYTVNWRFICLRLLNEEKQYGEDFPDHYIAGHGTGLKLLRVAAAIRDAEGPDRMGDLYTQWGGDIHVRGRRDEIVGQWEAGLGDYLRSVGVEDKYIPEANNEKWDDVLRAERDEALALTGKDVGTPIIGYNRDGLKQAFFGPVISEVPPPDRAVELWDAVWALATFKGFAELKRSLRDRPNTKTSLG
jgi:hypothetical protein